MSALVFLVQPQDMGSVIFKTWPLSLNLDYFGEVSLTHITGPSNARLLVTRFIYFLFLLLDFMLQLVYFSA